MKRLAFVILSVFIVNAYSDCINCPSGTTAPGAAAAPSVKFHGYTSEVNKYDGTTPTCYSPTANTLNGHLQGINLKLCSIKSTLDSLRTYDVNNTIRLDSIINAMDSNTIDIDVRLDSIITALGQFYNTNIVSSDSSINITSTVVGEVIKFDLSVVNDSLEVDSGNGLSGNGRALTPIKLGGTLTENTTLTGDKNINFNIRQGSFTNKYDTIQNHVLLAEYTSKYNEAGDFTTSDIGVRMTSIRDVRNGTWNLSSYEVNPTSTVFTTEMEMTSGAILLKTGDTSVIGWGDVTNVGLGFEAQNTTGGHITSAVNLALSAIYKGANSLPCTIYRYTSLALGDLNRATDSWIVPTVRYAIYQEGETDRVWLNSAIIVAPNLPVYANDAAAVADTAFPSGGLYLTTGSVVLKVKP